VDPLWGVLWRFFEVKIENFEFMNFIGIQVRWIFKNHAQYPHKEPPKHRKIEIDTIFDRILINIYRATHEKFQKKFFFLFQLPICIGNISRQPNQKFSFFSVDSRKLENSNFFLVVHFFTILCCNFFFANVQREKLFSLKVLETCLSVNQFLFCLRFDLNGKNCNFSILSKKKVFQTNSNKNTENLVQG